MAPDADPLIQALRRRIALTVAVRDTDRIPKVPNAGEVIVRNGERV